MLFISFWCSFNLVGKISLFLLYISYQWECWTGMKNYYISMNTSSNLDANSTKEASLLGKQKPTFGIYIYMIKLTLLCYYKNIQYWEYNYMNFTLIPLGFNIKNERCTEKYHTFFSSSTESNLEITTFFLFLVTETWSFPSLGNSSWCGVDSSIKGSMDSRILWPGANTPSRFLRARTTSLEHQFIHP